MLATQVTTDQADEVVLKVLIDLADIADLLREPSRRYVQQRVTCYKIASTNTLSIEYIKHSLM